MFYQSLTWNEEKWFQLLPSAVFSNITKTKPFCKLFTALHIAAHAAH